MTRSIWLVCAVLGTLWSADDAAAHFLFIRIGPHAEAGRHTDVFFSERAEAGDPKFIDRVKPS